MTAPRSLGLNVIFNLGGQFWPSLLTAITVPLFLRILGAESYGLVGLFATFQLVFAFFDFGLSTTVNREIARNLARHGDSGENTTLLRTFEVVYWAGSVCILIVILAVSGWISTHWIHTQHLSQDDARLAINVMALSFVFRWPVSLYYGVLQGLERQVLQNSISIWAGTVRSIGSLLVIALVAPTVTAFLLWQAVANALEVGGAAYLSWRELTKLSSARGRFDLDILKRVAGFALSFNTIAMLEMIAAQSDKLLISRFLPLEQLGYYSVAETAAAFTPAISLAVTRAVYPRFSGHTATGDIESLVRYYRSALQTISFAGAVIVVAFTLFPTDLLFAWTRSSEVAGKVSPILVPLVIGSFLYALLNPARTLLVAAGHTRVLLAVSVINVIIFIPMLFVLIPSRGVEGAALVWLGQCLVMLVAYSLYVSKVVLRHGRGGISLTSNVLPYLLPAILIVGSARLLTLSCPATVVSYVSLAGSGLVYEGAVILMCRRMNMFPAQYVDRFCTRWLRTTPW